MHEYQINYFELCNVDVVILSYFNLHIVSEPGSRRQTWDGQRPSFEKEPFQNQQRTENSRLGNTFSETDSAKRRGSNSSVDSR